ncbi:hypothetical protein IW261DRAFT_1439801 [Armillaria novae-zelandiae]|uniref:Uncharacterized protein n=1 Tax=Armillaria novae-zelandiae TaxID=153914 RepID=A0AA39PR46_9AGAR|nr:hypothetical protein IW261DRAFT_1439801 [Armillaria novae-zelandiae]
MVAIIILLYITTTINFSLNWALLVSIGRVVFFVKDYVELLRDLIPKVRMPNMGIGITAVMSTVVADSAMAT